MFCPPLRGKARYLDGTRVWVAAENNLVGDEIILTNELLEDVSGKPSISASAEGLLACRFSENGKLVALAAGGLKKFEGGGVVLDLSTQPKNLALWKTENGTWQYVTLPE
jgi:hypothetical protein